MTDFSNPKDRQIAALNDRIVTLTDTIAALHAQVETLKRDGRRMRARLDRLEPQEVRT